MVLLLEQLEQRFLEIAPENRFRVNKLPNFPSDIDKTISKGSARTDVAMLAKLLIQAYGGWPFYSKLLRRKILTVLSRIYNSISGPIKIRELYEQLKSIVAMMPDRHIMIGADKNPAINMELPINIGDNLVKSRNINKPYLIEKRGRIGIIAISRFFAPDDTDDLEHIRQRVLDIMSGTDAIIIDLRNNGGGSMHIASMLGKTLSGYDWIPRSRRMFTRNTPLARKLHQYITDFPAIKNIPNNAKDPVMIVDNSKFKMPRNHKWAFSGDIYILVNNRSASSSETVIEYLKYNPHTKLIGTHTSGCNQYVHYRFIELLGSGIHVRLPLVYKEVSHVKSQKFEMHGYTPDIECESSTDAMDLALTEANKNLIAKNMCH
jgi:hypothetical protein